MASPSVVVEHVWKKFRRGERHDTLRDLVPSLVRRAFGPRSASLRPEEFWALRDLSFTVSPGEALGVIGPNGAGKSTLLKMLSRILRPTSGRLALKGRVGSLIEVAAAFHPDLTGRENVYLQGAIMGMRRAEIARKFDDIVAFSGIEEFIDTPVKRYSSGMNARLGFSIAAHLDPDVLLVDEVLSVGDAGFQQQCVDRMRQLIARGTPVVFVSHNLPAVLQLCTRVMVVDHGTVLFDGQPAAGVAEYRRVPWARKAAAVERDARDVQIGRVQLLDEQHEDAAVFAASSRLTVRIGYEARRPVRCHFAVDIYSADGVYCAGINSRMDRRDFGVLEGGGVVDLAFPRLALLPGCYVISVGILDAQGLGPLDVQHRAYPFSVASEERDLGVVHLERAWRHESYASVAAGASAAGGLE